MVAKVVLCLWVVVATLALINPVGYYSPLGLPYWLAAVGNVGMGIAVLARIVWGSSW